MQLRNSRAIHIATLFALTLLLPPRSVEAAAPLDGAVLRVLPNGLRLIVREQHSAPLVAVDAWVRAGSGREGPAESGAAHFLEHLLFKGTATRKAGEVDAAIEDLGATLSAGTTRDAAHFYTTVSSQHVEIALEVIADMLQNAALRPPDVESERTVILDEMARAQNDPGKQALNALYAAALGEAGYGRPVLGAVESLRTIKPEAIEAFYRRWYAPNNTTLVIVGDITPDAAEALVKAAVGAWKQRELPPEPSPLGTPTQKSVPSEHMVWVEGYRLADSFTVAEAAAAQVSALLLADPDIGRLRQAPAVSDAKPVVRPTSIARRLSAPAPPATETVSAEADPLRSGGVLYVWAVVDGKSRGPISDAISSDLRRMTTESPSEQELEFAKRKLLGWFLYEAETYGGQARLLGQYDLLGDYKMAAGYTEAVRGLKAQDVTDFLTRTAVPGRRIEASVPRKAVR